MFGWQLLQFNLFLKFLQFGLVGLTGLILDFGITYLLKEKLEIHKYISNTIGFTVAVTSNYLFNNYWTFNSEKEANLPQFSKFLGIAVIGLVLNNLIIHLCNDKLKWNFYMSKAFAVLLVAVWNFAGNYLYTFEH